jgi:alanyl-tRNA synthetase
MDINQIRKKYLEFFVSKKHQSIPSASLVPEHDPSALFITAGMHPLVPYLLGQKHPKGNRLVNYQKCIRTQDIDEVGDNWHLTFFEMMGNWSLNAYSRQEAINFAWEFITDKKWLDINKEKIWVSVYEGDSDIKRDLESFQAWAELGISEDKIFFYGRDKNWWGPVGQEGPCGPDSEIFIETSNPHTEEFGKICHPNCNCGRFVEIWNLVFMEYEKKISNERNKFSYLELKQKNIDTGMGLERIAAVLQNKKNVYEINSLSKIFDIVCSVCADKTDIESMRIIVDHLRAATIILSDGITPSNVDQGYVLRRLIRRAIRHSKKLSINQQKELSRSVAREVIDQFKDYYPNLLKNKKFILEEIQKEENKFEKTLDLGLKQFNKIIKNKINNSIAGEEVFKLYDTYGFPVEITEELAKEKNFIIDKRGFCSAFLQHQKKSRQSAENKFKGGLADCSEITIKYHTATHILQEVLRRVLGKHVRQKGSNITPERLRFDFSHPQKLTSDELKEIEDKVNQIIIKDYKINMRKMKYFEAKKLGALFIESESYPDEVNVYSIDNFSKEICGGPHIDSTGKLGKFRIIKEESSGADIRRIKAVLE